MCIFLKRVRTLRFKESAEPSSISLTGFGEEGFWSGAFSGISNSSSSFICAADFTVSSVLLFFSAGDGRFSFLAAGSGFSAGFAVFSPITIVFIRYSSGSFIIPVFRRNIKMPVVKINIPLIRRITSSEIRMPVYLSIVNE